MKPEGRVAVSKDFEIKTSGIKSDEDSLASALVASNAVTGNKSLVKQIFFSWSNLEAITLRMAGVISSSFPSNDEGVLLLSSCISAATAAYQDAQGNCKDDFSPPASYIQAMLTSASAGLARYDVFGLKGEISARWEISETNLVTFAQQWDRLTLVARDADNDIINGLYIVLASRTLRVDDAALLSKLLQRPMCTRLKGVRFAPFSCGPDQKMSQKGCCNPLVSAPLA